MSEFEQTNSDELWRKVFDDAAETPPPRVWDAIERQLDDSDGAAILPLWSAGATAWRPLAWGTGVAAAIVLLLVGWWIYPDRTNPTVAHHHAPTSPDHVAASATKSGAPGRVQLSIKPAEESLVAAATSAKPATVSNRPLVSRLTTSRPTESLGTTAITPAEAGRILRVGDQRTSETTVSDPFANNQLTDRVASASSANSRFAATTAHQSTDLQSFELLKGQPLRLREAGPIQRIVWIRPTEPATEPERIRSKNTSREVWASVSMMPGSFNPSVSIRSMPVLASNTLVLNYAPNTAAVNSRANFSVAYQAGAGVQLTEYWSVESGVGYLAGHSTVESPAQGSVAAIQFVSNGQRSVGSNVFVDALQNSLSSKPAYPSADNKLINNGFAAVYDNQASMSLANNYQYVQVPVQVGYQLRPRKRLGVSLLGGLLTNIFVRNTVGDELVVTASDGVYRPLSWAATMGARLRYRPSRQWSASLAGVYQPALGSGSQSGSQVQSHPTSAGMSFGIDYHF